MKVVTGGISHETSTFTPVPTTWQNYDEHYNLRGADILEMFRGTNTPTGGFISGSEAHGFELIPTVFAEAYPSAPTPAPILQALLDEMLDRIAAALPVDGVLLELHGAMVAEGIDDVEGYLLSAVRKLVGPEVPIVGQLDIHSHMSREMIESADVLIGRKTYPEIDMAERGRQCADVLFRMLTEGLSPTMALSRISMAAMGGNDVTEDPPMSEVMQELRRIEARQNVVCGSLSHGFPFADVPDMGLSVFVVTDNDQSAAQRYADELSDWIFRRRHRLWDFPQPTTADVIRQARSTQDYPLIVADTNDNPGGGSGGDSTGMLRTFYDAKLERACVLYMVDPAAVDLCLQAGVGAVLTLQVGGKSSPLQGRPVEMRVEVVALSDGTFVYEGPMYAGLSGCLGPSAHVKEGGLHVILVSKREQPFDSALARNLGLETRQMRYLGLKSSGHFRASFASWAGSVHVVYEPCVHDFTLKNMTFRRLGRQLYPLTDL